MEYIEDHSEPIHFKLRFLLTTISAIAASTYIITAVTYWNKSPLNHPVMFPVDPYIRIVIFNCLLVLALIGLVTTTILTKWLGDNIEDSYINVE